MTGLPGFPAVDALIEEAKLATGLEDLGPDLSFMEGLHQLVAAVATMEAPDHLRSALHAKIVGLLSARFHYVEDAKCHPEILHRMSVTR